MGNVTLNVVKENGDKKQTYQFTINVENENLINSIITIGENNTITESQMKQLQEAAARGGNLGILEQSDLSPNEVINLADTLGFSEYYDIKLSNDKKLYQVTIKDAGTFTKNPNLADIKHDFGVRNNVFVQKGNIPYGNEALIRNADVPMGERNHDYDRIVLKVGQTINIPVNEVNLASSPNGFWSRLFN